MILGSFHPEQLVRLQLAKTAMNLANPCSSGCASAQSAAINPPLYLDMRFGFELQISFSQIRAVVVLQRSFDVDRMGIVAFDQIAVVAIHRADQIRQRSHNSFGQASPEPGRLGCQLDGQIGELAAEP